MVHMSLHLTEHCIAMIVAKVDDMQTAAFEPKLQMVVSMLCSMIPITNNSI